MPSTKEDIESADASWRTGDINVVTDEIDQNVFEQILEMDDDEERDFSKSIVFDFFEQANSTFTLIDKALEEKDLKVVSEQGHFLKGSSATLGMFKVKDSCEKIQHCGARKDETGEHDEPNDDKSIDKIQKYLSHAKADFKRAEVLLKKFYGEQ